MVFGWFRKKKAVPTRSATSVHWATFLSLEQQRRVEQLVLAFFAKSGKRAELGDDGCVRCDGFTYGLDNVAKACRPLPADEWPAQVEHHFALILASQGDQTWENASSNWITAEPFLRIRLQHPDVVGSGVGDALVWRRDLEGAVTVLVADLPTHTVTVHREQLAAWGVAESDVMARAQAATLRDNPITWESVVVDKATGASLMVASADHIFVTTHALELGRHPDALGVEGCVFAVPDRQSMLVLPVQPGAHVVLALTHLIGIAQHRFAQGPGSVCPEVYWRRPDGRIEHQPCAAQQGKLAFQPTADLVAAVDRCVGRDPR